ncbi:MAG: glycosyltransferase family 4 protein, partial [Rhodospirillaceae bacterium]|nr:glycosyltransferase family 4 protein [Rhodospirillaceae bacterium]
MPQKTRLAYLVSHPIQYQVPLLRLIAADPDIDLTVFFCSDFSVRPHRDDGFGQTIQWDVPLLDGYDHIFLPASAGDTPPSVFRPVNYGLAKHLKDGDYDVLWVHGYTRFYHLISMIGARLQGRIVLNRDEAWDLSSRRGPLKNAVKRMFLAILRRICHGWLVIGSANRDYYQANGMAPETLFSMPYAVDNEVFRDRALAAASTRDALRRDLNLEPDRPVILFASKFQPRKRPDDLLAAFARLSDDPAARRPYLVLVGDGEDRAALEQQVKELGMEPSVRFAGFQNQSEIPRYYDLCQVFVLPSLLEPWGLVINEVMNAGRAVIVSDQVGAAADLVRDGDNGFVFPAGDIDA